MAYIKWRRKKPFVYRSSREKQHEVKLEEGMYKVRDLEDRIKSEYLGGYRDYRMKRPCGSYKNLIKPEKVLKMMADERWKLDMLSQIDAEANANC